MKHSEHLLSVGDNLLTPRHKIVIATVTGDKAVDEVLLARAKLAMDFARKRKSFIFTSLVEGWEMERIKREMY